MNYIDEVENSVIQAMLVLNFKKIYAMHMVSAVKEAIWRYCEGCQLELPSQLDHTCLGENVLTHLNTYWAEALEILCHGSVVFEFFTWCQAEGLPADQLSITKAFYDAGGVWTQDIKGLAASYFANNNNNSNNSSTL